MEINKQLFEDVLSDKLKGAFVFRNQLTCNSDELIRNTTGKYKFTHPYIIANHSYTPNGTYFIDGESNVDIVDFIRDMKENELTIEIPDGKIVDWDESKKQNKIVLKDKQLTYEDVCTALYKDKIVYYTDARGNISSMPFSELDENNPYDSNNASTEHQLECILAKNKLATVAKYLNDGWKPTNMEDAVYYLNMDLDSRIFVGSCSKLGGYYFGKIMFKSGGLAKQAIEILGEETVKLALEPLGI